MVAFHTNWTKPFLASHAGIKYFIPDYNLLSTILSALEWRKHNGSIKMLTDECGAEYYTKNGLSAIWDLGIDTSLENAISERINPKIFWAAGKIYALQRMSLPCVMMDTDFVVWQSIEKMLENVELAVIHREKITICHI